jgi:glycosyltransferase involved in cell wall biosynthesis
MQLPPHPTRIWDIVPDREILRMLREAPNLIVSVGTIGLSGAHHELIAAFSFLLAMQCDARLVFIDGASINEHTTMLTNFIAQQNLSSRVHVAAACSREQLAAYYRCASLLCALDDDQALYPLLDAMWFDIPILTLATPLRGELLGQAGVLVTTREEPAKLAALMKILLRNEELRTTLLAAQHSQRQSLHHHILERCSGEQAGLSSMRRTA